MVASQSKIGQLPQFKDNEAVESVIEIDKERTESVEKEFPFPMPELDVQIAIHGMSYQKVRASSDDEWDL